VSGFARPIHGMVERLVLSLLEEIL
jgi:hypothetical protein